jgi:hypothetical protein
LKPRSLCKISSSFIPHLGLELAEQCIKTLLTNLLGFLNPNLRTVKLPSELFNKKGSVIAEEEIDSK